MLRAKAIIRFSAFSAVIAWLALVFAELSIVFADVNNIRPGISEVVPRIAFNAFLLFIFIFYKYRIEKAESINFIDLLWKIFVTGLITTIISLIFRLFHNLLGETRLAENIVLLDFLYLVNLGLVSTFVISTLIVCKRLILYQKSKFLMNAWQFFEYALLGTLVYNVISFPLKEEVFGYYWIALIILTLFLSVNMKWVAYLNFKQKWKSILLIALALFYLGYFTWTIFSLSLSIEEVSTKFSDFKGHIFILSGLTFIGIYALFSMLVILFNLPTSSVFEQKLEEVVNFQRLSQSVQTEQSEERVYDILLESSVSTVFADAGWLEVNNGNTEPIYFMHNISKDEVRKVKDHIRENKIKGILDQSVDKTKNIYRQLATLKNSKYRSIMASPLVVKNEQIGTLALLKDVAEGFTKEMTKIVDTFTNQAGISIENFRLLSEALENERYKEELKIAKKVQSSLLPEQLDQDHSFEVVAFSESADEVGGDYYDTYRISDHKIALVIGDVSGKGTSAAFHMSQMKGVFNSLAQMDLEPKDFLVKANTALSRCLERTSFITASYFVIDSKKKQIQFARAGHCPALYFNKEENCVRYFEDKGLGLGIVRSEDYRNYVQVNTINYQSGDIVLLYTDGITEAKNAKGQEFGYERLQKAIKEVSQEPPEAIQQNLIKKLYQFSETESIDDDYTTMIVKFK